MKRIKNPHWRLMNELQFFAIHLFDDCFYACLKKKILQAQCYIAAKLYYSCSDCKSSGILLGSLECTTSDYSEDIIFTMKKYHHTYLPCTDSEVLSWFTRTINGFDCQTLKNTNATHIQNI